MTKKAFRRGSRSVPKHIGAHRDRAAELREAFARLALEDIANLAPETVAMYEHVTGDKIVRSPSQRRGKVALMEHVKDRLFADAHAQGKELTVLTWSGTKPPP